jgi:hypothetical protein
MSAKNAIVEPGLRVIRYARTVQAVRRFDAQSGPERTMDGEEFFRMRSAMEVAPGAGKAISRLGIRKGTGGTPTANQAKSSNFVDFGEIDTCVAGLERNGVYVFDQLLPSDMVDRMRSSALNVPSSARGLDKEPSPFPRTSPEVGRYDVDEDHTMVSSDMQDYVSDPALALIAARYLKQPVIQDQTALWWTTTQGAADAAMNAWLFHQDRDRLSFLKFFVYLTDVGPDNGPHTVVQGTHRSLPQSLRKDGRQTDDAVREAGLWDQVISLSGPAGTMMAVDTAGLHKGLPPVADDRCVLQVEFATSLFGAPVDYPVFTPSALAAERYKHMPQVLQRWHRSFQ